MIKIDDILKNKLDDYSAEPSDKMWDLIVDKMEDDKPKKRMFSFKLLGYAASFLLLLACSFGFYLSDKTYKVGVFSSSTDYKPIKTETLDSYDTDGIYSYANLKSLEQAYKKKYNLSQGLK